MSTMMVRNNLIEDAVSWDSYAAGNEDRLIELWQVFKTSQERQENQLVRYSLRNAGDVTRKIKESLKNNGFEMLDAFVRLNDATTVEILAFVPEDGFLSDDFIKMYDIAQQIEAESKSEVFDVTITFSGENKAFDDSAVASEGYFYRFKKD